MVRIGEILLEHGWVDSASLQRGLAEQSIAGGRRICSLLIARGLLDPDNAARALGEQYEVAAALQRHLEHRDPSLVGLLTATFARTYFALPIGRTRGGEIIVCVRDPNPAIDDAVKRAITTPVVIAVAPAMQLEQLIDSSYDPVDEFDVDLSTGTQIEPVFPRIEPDPEQFDAFTLADLDDVRVTKVHNLTSSTTLPQRTTPPPFNTVTPPFNTMTPPFNTVTPPFGAFNPPTEPPRRISPFASISPPISEAAPAPISEAAPAAPIESAATAATAAPAAPAASPAPAAPAEIELPLPTPTPRSVQPRAPTPSPVPAPVDRPPTSPSVPAPPVRTSPPPVEISPAGPNRAMKVLIPPIGAPLPRAPIKTSPQPAVVLAIGDVIAAIDESVTRDLATDVAMRYATQRWSSSLLLAVKEGAALGHRGHGPQLSPGAIRAVAIPLTTPSIVKAAHDTGELVTTVPAGAGAIQERLLRLLGQPRAAVAAPITIAGRIACVMAVGDSINGGDSGADLDRLASALGHAFTRILREMK